MLKVRCPSVSGFSMVEVLVVMGLMGVLSLFVAGIMKAGHQTQRSLAQTDATKNLMDDIVSLLKDSDACKSTFSGSNKPATGFAVSSIKDSGNNTKYSTGTTYYKVMKITSITVGGAGVNAHANVERFTSTGANSGTALVAVAFTKTGASDANVGPSTLNRYFFIDATLDGSGNLTDCVATGGVSTASGLNGSGTNGYLARWLGTDTLGNSEVYQDGSGNVGIGTTTPASKLHVAGGMQAGNDAGACNASKAGTIRWTGSAFEGCNGSAWAALGGGPAPGTAGSPCTTSQFPSNKGVTMFANSTHGGGRFCCGYYSSSSGYNNVYCQYY